MSYCQMNSDTRVKLFVDDNIPQLDDHCAYCDDGGHLIQCCQCELYFCFVIVASLSPTDNEIDPTNEPCILLPPIYEHSWKDFWCPFCLADRPYRAIDYTIRRGSRATQRRVVGSEIVFIVACLPDLVPRCRKILGVAFSTLAAFQVLVSYYFLTSTENLSPAALKAILSLQHPYHLVFVYMTEGSLGGGLFFGSHQAEEVQWLRESLKNYDEIAQKAISARVFGIACGINLTCPKVVANISTEMQRQPWQSLVTPAVASLTPEEYGCIFPQLFIQLYYVGSPLHSALVRVWAASKRARLQTDLLVIDKSGTKSDVPCKYTYGSMNSRPWGVDLPIAFSVCQCARLQKPSVKWKIRSGTSFEHGEHFARYFSSCHHSVARIAVFAGSLEILNVAGVQVVKQYYDSETDSFPLDRRENSCVRVSKRENEPAIPPGTFTDHNSPWTISGQHHMAGHPGDMGGE